MIFTPSNDAANSALSGAPSERRQVYTKAPTTRHQALVQAGQRLTHTLGPTDEPTPTRRARPKGVQGAEVWVKLVEPGEPAPADPDVLSILKVATKPKIRADFRAGDGGKSAVYIARRVNTRGERGTWNQGECAMAAALGSPSREVWYRCLSSSPHRGAGV